MNERNAYADGDISKIAPPKKNTHPEGKAEEGAANIWRFSGEKWPSSREEGHLAIIRWRRVLSRPTASRFTARGSACLMYYLPFSVFHISSFRACLRLSVACLTDGAVIQFPAVRIKMALLVQFSSAFVFYMFGIANPAGT